MSIEYSDVPGIITSLQSALVGFQNAAAVDLSTSDYVPSTTGRALFVGGAGTVKLDTPNQTGVVLSSVPAGTILPIATKKVIRGVTSATGLVVFW